MRYEVGVSIINGDIVWIHGPFRCGMNDLQILREILFSYLDENERVEAGNGYTGESPRYTKTPASLFYEEERKDMGNISRERHETVNRRFKDWSCLKMSLDMK